MDIDAEAFARRWYDAWNALDLDAIMEHYAEGVVFTSQLALARGVEDGTLRGKEALRAYFAEGLAAAPDLRFEPLDLLVGPGGLTLYYAGYRGVRVAETMLFDASGRAWHCHVHYARAGARRG